MELTAKTYLKQFQFLCLLVLLHFTVFFHFLHTYVLEEKNVKDMGECFQWEIIYSCYYTIHWSVFIQSQFLCFCLSLVENIWIMHMISNVSYISNENSVLQNIFAAKNLSHKMSFLDYWESQNLLAKNVSSEEWISARICIFISCLISCLVS